MNVRKIKKKCMVKGCRNVDTYTISKIRDYGNSVLICPECLQSALKAIKSGSSSGEPKQQPTPDEPLFYNHLTQLPQPQEAVAEKHICSKCGRECSSKSGLQSHEKACAGK